MKHLVNNNNNNNNNLNKIKIIHLDIYHHLKKRKEYVNQKINNDNNLYIINVHSIIYAPFYINKYYNDSFYIYSKIYIYIK